MRPKRALITGITGQDGSYLAELLLDNGYEVHGLIRRASTFGTDRIDHLYRDPHERGSRLLLHYADLTDASGLAKALRQIEPTEVYNLAAQSHVRVSFDQPIYTAEVAALGALKLLEAVRDNEQRTGQRVRYYQASSSEMFGQAPACAEHADRAEVPQDEHTPLHPRSPYAVAKVYAHWATINYRESYGLHASCGILFNHESPRRGETFVTRKITRAVGRIKHGLQKKLYLGNLEAQRDWGFAGDYVEAMWLMLQQDEPDDFVVATGRKHSVRTFCECAFDAAGLDYRDFIATDPRYYRPAEVDTLQGDATKAQRVLGWRPRVEFDQLVRIMIDHDMELAAREKTLRDAGHEMPLLVGHDQ